MDYKSDDQQFKQHELLLFGGKELLKNYIMKVCCIGDFSVGKTSMLKRYCQNKFEENYIMTIGSNFTIKTLEIPKLNATAKLQLWEIAEQGHFQFVRTPFYRTSEGVVYVFDITRRESFENIINWKNEVDAVIPNKPFVLVGNKADLTDERVVSKEEGESFASKFDGCVGYYETSVKTGENIDEAFLKLVTAIIKN